MALNATTLGALIGTKIDAAMEEAGPTGAEKRAAAYKGLAEAIVEHFQAAAVVTITAVTVPGVTPGPGTSGSGTGSGTIG